MILGRAEARGVNEVNPPAKNLFVQSDRIVLPRMFLAEHRRLSRPPQHRSPESPPPFKSPSLQVRGALNSRTASFLQVSLFCHCSKLSAKLT